MTVRPESAADPASPVAVVLLSGGLDSATVLAAARREGRRCHALAVDYGQRHRSELAAARRVADAGGAASFRVAPLDLRIFGGSALTDDAIDVPQDRTDEAIAGGVPVTYVPARNLVMLALATAYAETLEATEVWIGVNQVDYSGYPDCRREFIDAFARTATLATRAGAEDGRTLEVHTPLIDLPKSGIVRLGTELGVDYALTVSCYLADDDGRACGRCDSCTLRRRGFAEAGLPDPTRYVAGAPA